MAQTNVYDKLKELGIELPSAGAPAAAYVMSAQSGNTVYLSGHIAKKDGKVGPASSARRSPPKKARPPHARSRSTCSPRCTRMWAT